MHMGYRRDGMTAARKAQVCEALAKYGNVRDACRAAGISNTTYYRHEKKDPEFASRCAAARAQSAGRIETLAWQRAVEGAPETVIRGGEVVQIKMKPSDAMLGMLLRASAPEKYAPQAAALREQIEKELRPRIEAEVRAELRAERLTPEKGDALRKQLEEMLSDFNRRMGGNG
jgi:hypothetical protein